MTTLRRMTQNLSASEVSPTEWAYHLSQMNDAHEVAREGYVMYLKHSGERITDLLSLPTEELRVWFSRVRDANERQMRRQKELLEKTRRMKGGRR